MREFTIVHISDLHIKTDSAKQIKLLIRAIHNKLKTSLCPKPYILVITGDIVDQPCPRLLLAAQKTINLFTKIFSDNILVVPGNHDIKWYGNFFRRSDYKKYYGTSAGLSIPGLGLHIININSTYASFARGQITPMEYDKIYYEMLKNEKPNEGEHVLRIMALHHHPLPITSGEDIRTIGIKDEQYMYLQSPAKFLEMCLASQSPLILHGHRHVTGLTRYSTIKCNDSKEKVGNIWSEVHILSCPSSLNQDAGFNIITFHIGHDTQYMDIKRFSRRNRCPFDLNDDWGPVRLPIDIKYVQDTIKDLQFKIAHYTEYYSSNGHKPLIRELFDRPAFQIKYNRDWKHLLKIYCDSYNLWQDGYVKIFKDSEIDSKHITESLHALIHLVGLDLFKIDKTKLEGMTQDILLQLPSIVRTNSIDSFVDKQRSLLRDISLKLSNIGIVSKVGDNTSDILD